MINKDVLIREFTEAVQEMRRTHGYGTYYWILSEDNTNRWAIVLGWADGFEEDPADNNLDGAWRICAKMAYQPINSIMQCDYDIDWLMPYDKETMEVDDNEVSIYPGTDLADVIDWLLECYSHYNIKEIKL
jgi:hypothetical protein